MTKGNDVVVQYPPAFEREKVGELAVARDEVYESPLSQVTGRFVPIHGIRVLTLEDGTVTYGCRDCEETGDGPGKIRAHRRAEHHFAEEGATPKPPKRAGGVGQLTLPGTNAMSRTLYELIDMASEIETYEEAMERLDEENQRLRAQLQDEKITHRQELSAMRSEHRQSLTEARSAGVTAEKELAKLRNKIKRMIGTEDN